MDVCGVYVGDTNMSFGSVRSAYYRDYEQFPYGTLEHTTGPIYKDSYSRVQEKCQQIKTEKTTKKECPFCKEHKKRPLITYLRKRGMRKHHESICEGKEDEEVEVDDEQLRTENEQNNLSSFTTSTIASDSKSQRREEDFCSKPGP